MEDMEIWDTFGKKNRSYFEKYAKPGKWLTLGKTRHT